MDEAKTAITKSRSKIIKPDIPDQIIQTGFVVTDENLKLIKSQICYGLTDTELEYFLYICKKTGLNPLLKQIYAIKRNTRNPETKQYEMKLSIQIGIDGFRIIAVRTGEYLGQTPYFWIGADTIWRDFWFYTNTPPAAAKVGIYRKNCAEPTWGYANYLDYCQKNKDGTPTQFWQKYAADMTGKVAETKGLRRTFPMELSGLYGVEEMQQSEFAINSESNIPNIIHNDYEVVNNNPNIQTATYPHQEANYSQVINDPIVTHPQVPTQVQPPPQPQTQPPMPMQPQPTIPPVPVANPDTMGLQKIQYDGTLRDICAATWNFYQQNEATAKRIFNLENCQSSFQVLKWIKDNGKLFNNQKHLEAIGYVAKNAPPVMKPYEPQEPLQPPTAPVPPQTYNPQITLSPDLTPIVLDDDYDYGDPITAINDIKDMVSKKSHLDE